MAPAFDDRTPIDSLGFSNDLVYGTLTSGHDTAGGVTFAVHPDTGAIAWSTNRPQGRDFLTERGITPDAVITQHLTGDPTTANDARTGRLLWRDTESAQVAGIAGDLVYLSQEDTVRILRASDGTLVTQFRLNPAPPPFEGIATITPSGGRLYIAAAAHLYAFAPA
jgi:outer membrane protein assembly factor BamB